MDEAVRLPGILLLHAYTGSPFDMNFLAKSLMKVGYPVLCPTFTGHGTSDPIDILKQGSSSKWWADTKNGIASLVADTGGPIYAFGLSLGGIFAMNGILECNAVIGGGVFGSPIIPNDTAAITGGFIGNAHKLYQMHHLTDQVIHDKMNVIDSLLPEQLTDIETFSAQELPKLPFNKKPVFIGQGMADKLVDPRLAAELRDQLINCNVTYQEYPTCGHVITVNGAHHQLEKDVLQFLQQK